MRYKSADLIKILESIPEIIRLEDKSYIIRRKQSVKKVLGAVEYSLSHPSVYDNKDALELTRSTLHDALSALEKQKIEGDDLLDSFARFSGMHDEIVKMISTAKERLSQESFCQYAPDELIITDSLIKHYFKEKKLKASRHVRREDIADLYNTVDKVLNIIYSMGLVIMGKYQLETSDFEYFYFDINLIHKSESWWDDRLRRLAGAYPKRADIVKIHEKIREILRRRLLERYKQNLTKLRGEFDALYVKLADPYNRDNFSKAADIYNEYVILRRQYEKMRAHLNAENIPDKLFELRTDYIKPCEERLEAVGKYLDAVPIQFRAFIKGIKDYGNINKNFEFESLIYQCTFLRNTEEGKHGLLVKMWKAFAAEFSKYIAVAYKFELSTVVIGGVEKDIIRYREFYISHNDHDGKFYIYSYTDKSVEFSVNTARSLLPPIKWTENSAAFIRMFQLLRSFIDVRNFFIQFIDKLEAGTL